MTKVCRQCGYWIEFLPGLGWLDEEDDDQCYDENTNLIGDGLHHPKEDNEEAKMVYTDHSIPYPPVW